MTTATLSREIALRVGLAARELPDTDVKQLLFVLLEAVGDPITEAKLAGLKVKDLKTSADGALSALPVETLKAALHHLKDGLEEVSDLPTVKPYTEGDLPDSIRVAFASNNAELVDGHFGSCARFLVYQVNQAEARLIDIRSTAGDHDAEDKNVFRTDLIKDCQVLYLVSVGGPAAAKIIKANIHPVKMPEGGSIPDVLAQLQPILGEAPPPWLAKVMGKSPEERKRFTSDEEETE